MEFTGKLIGIADRQFKSTNGGAESTIYYKEAAISNDDGEFPRIAVFEFRTDRAIECLNDLSPKEGQRVTVTFEFDGFRSSKTGAYFNRLRAWKMTRA